MVQCREFSTKSSAENSAHGPVQGIQHPGNSAPSPVQGIQHPVQCREFSTQSSAGNSAPGSIQWLVQCTKSSAKFNNMGFCNTFCTVKPVLYTQIKFSHKRSRLETNLLARNPVHIVCVSGHTITARTSHTTTTTTSEDKISSLKMRGLLCSFMLVQNTAASVYAGTGYCS